MRAVDGRRGERTSALAEALLAFALVLVIAALVGVFAGAGDQLDAPGPTD